MIESLGSRAPIAASITDVRTDELEELKIVGWITDSLLLDDLGYHDYGKIVRIDELGGWFLNRLKVDSNAPIIEELERWPAGAISGWKGVARCASRAPLKLNRWSRAVQYNQFRERPPTA